LLLKKKKEKKKSMFISHPASGFNLYIMVIATSVTNNANPAMERPAVT